MALDKFQPYLFVSAGEQSNKYLTPTITNGIAQFQAQRAQSLTGLTVRFNPIQEGTGDPYPPGGGVNKLNLAECNPANSAFGITITISGDEVVLSGTYTGERASPQFRLFQYSDSRVISYNAKGFAADSATSSNFAGHLGKADNGTAITVLLTNMVQNTAYTLRIKPVLYEGSTAPTAWSPYSNICPISGRTGLTATVQGGETERDYPISWQTEAGTVYGGTLDVVSGVLTVTDAQIASYAGETLPGEWISDRDVYAAGINPTIGAQVVYKLATPQTYQLSPTDVKTLAGFNQVYSDAGPVIDIKF